MTLQFNSYKLGWKKLALLQDCGSQLIVCVCVCGISGGWSSWGNWGECSTECGGGVQTRTRVCQSPPEEAYLCAGVLEEGHPCNPQPCIGEFCSVCVIADGFVLLHSSFSCLFSFPIFLSPSTLSRCTLYNFWSDFAVTDKNHIQKIFCSWVENGGLRRHNVTFTGTDFSATVTKDSWQSDCTAAATLIWKSPKGGCHRMTQNSMYKMKCLHWSTWSFKILISSQ